MHELTPRTIAILRRYAHDAAASIADATTLAALEIDRLDLPMIVLDIEDAFNIHVQYDDDIGDCATVGDLVALVVQRIEARRSEQRALAATPRIKRSWISTEAVQR